MDIGSSTCEPLNVPDVTEKVVAELKSQGLFDQLRKECMADVDTKPAYQNLQQRVENIVSDLLQPMQWTPDMNKNQVRDIIKKGLMESHVDSGVDRLLNQVINPKLYKSFLPYVEDVLCNILGLKKPNKDKNQCNEITSAISDLPEDLDPISPGEKFGEDIIDLDVNSDKSIDSMNASNSEDDQEQKEAEKCEVMSEGVKQDFHEACRNVTVSAEESPVEKSVLKSDAENSKNESTTTFGGSIDPLHAKQTSTPAVVIPEEPKVKQNLLTQDDTKEDEESPPFEALGEEDIVSFKEITNLYQSSKYDDGTSTGQEEAEDIQVMSTVSNDSSTKVEGASKDALETSPMSKEEIIPSVVAVKNPETNESFVEKNVEMAKAKDVNINSSEVEGKDKPLEESKKCVSSKESTNRSSHKSSSSSQKHDKHKSSKLEKDHKKRTDGKKDDGSSSHHSNKKRELTDKNTSSERPKSSSSTVKPKSEPCDKQENESSNKHKNGPSDKNKCETSKKHKNGHSSKHKSESMSDKPKSEPPSKHKSESSDKHKGEFPNKHKTEPSDKHRNDLTNKHRNESSNKNKKESTNKHKSESTDKHKSESSKKNKNESSDKRKSDATNKHKNDSNDKQKLETSAKQKSDSSDKMKTDFSRLKQEEDKKICGSSEYTSTRDKPMSHSSSHRSSTSNKNLAPHSSGDRRSKGGSATQSSDKKKHVDKEASHSKSQHSTSTKVHSSTVSSGQNKQGKTDSSKMHNETPEKGNSKGKESKTSHKSSESKSTSDKDAQPKKFQRSLQYKEINPVNSSINGTGKLLKLPMIAENEGDVKNIIKLRKLYKKQHEAAQKKDKAKDKTKGMSKEKTKTETEAKRQKLEESVYPNKSQKVEDDVMHLDKPDYAVATKANAEPVAAQCEQEIHQEGGHQQGDLHVKDASHGHDNGSQRSIHTEWKEECGDENAEVLYSNNLNLGAPKIQISESNSQEIGPFAEAEKEDQYVTWLDKPDFKATEVLERVLRDYEDQSTCDEDETDDEALMAWARTFGENKMDANPVVEPGSQESSTSAASVPIQDNPKSGPKSKIKEAGGKKGKLSTGLVFPVVATPSTVPAKKTKRVHSEPETRNAKPLQPLQQGQSGTNNFPVKKAKLMNPKCKSETSKLQKQRYDNEDLYKPHFSLSSTRRMRNAATEAGKDQPGDVADPKSANIKFDHTK